MALNKNDKIRIGITGQAGFIGTHLYNYLGLCNNIKRVPFLDEYFEHENKLTSFVSACDAIVHLAAVNRHADAQIMHDTNVGLVSKLIVALERAGNKPHVIFSSSTQEKRNNLYGNSKWIGRQLLIEWAEKHDAPFTGMVIPNVFGPFGSPFYNSVIATFSHQLVRNLEPKIEIDADLSLIYVNDLASLIYQVINNRQIATELEVSELFQARVTGILAKLATFKKQYMASGIIPDLSDYFDLCLFNTFRSYLPGSFFPKTFEMNADDRGQFVELVKTANAGQTSFSTTHPGVTRGNHFHTRKVERFIVIRGQAEIQLRRIGMDKIIKYHLSGDQPAYVDIPVWHTHNITNAGSNELCTIFWINELFNHDDPDTFFEKVIP